MSAEDQVAATTERVLREYERALLRTRNGLRFAAGTLQPDVGRSPRETVWSSGRAELWRYRNDDVRVAPPVFIVPSLVSRSYILDLLPKNSFVGALGRAGLDVFLLDWGVPDRRDAGNTFETYVDDLVPRGIEAALHESGAEEVTLVGHCFGGVLALLLGATHPELPVRSMVTLATPVDYDRLGVIVGLLREGRLEPDALLDQDGNVPAEVISAAFRLLKPTDDLVQYVTMWENLWNDEFMEGYLAINGWAKDQVPFPGALCRQVTTDLIRGNALVRGGMRVGGREVDLGAVDRPLLNVVAEKDNIVPVASADVVESLVGSADATTLRLPTGHIGYVVGRAATRTTIPSIIEWIRAHSEERETVAT